MLVISRRPSESLRNGDHIKLKILDFKGKQVRIGIDALDDVSIHREEIYQRIRANEPQALSIEASAMDA